VPVSILLIISLNKKDLRNPNDLQAAEVKLISIERNQAL
jgi:hypothetical protein